MIKVVIIDDHQLVIDGLELMLENDIDIQVVGSVTSGQAGINLVGNVDVDVVLLDINMPVLNGIETCKLLRTKYEDLSILALSMIKEVSLIKLMLKNGANGYIVKNAGKEEVKEAIKAVHQGKRFLSQEVNEIIFDSLKGGPKTKSPFPKLSRREKEIAGLILDEMTTQEIAEKLFISFGTVETHRRNMMTKLGTRNTAGLVKTIMEYNLL